MLIFLKIIKKGLRLLSCFTICFLTVIVAMQVVNRNFFDHSFTWVEEVASILMIYVTFFGAAIATINNSNTRIDFFIRLLPNKLYSIFEMIDDLISIAFLSIVIRYSYLGVLKNFSMHTAALHLPMSINYLAIVLGSILMIAFYLAHLYVVICKMMGRDVSFMEEAFNQ